MPGSWAGVAAALQHADPALRRRSDRGRPPAEGSGRPARAGSPTGPTSRPLIRLEALRAIVIRRPRLSPARLRLPAGPGGRRRDAVPGSPPRKSCAPARSARISRRSGRDPRRPAHLAVAFVPALKAGTAALEERRPAIRSGWRPSTSELGPLLPKLPMRAPSSRRARRRSPARPVRAPHGRRSAKGREIFAGKESPASTCHSVGAQGGKVGPDSPRSARSAGRDLLESILAPELDSPRATSHLILTQDGAVLGADRAADGGRGRAPGFERQRDPAPPRPHPADEAGGEVGHAGRAGTGHDETGDAQIFSRSFNR